MPDRAIPGVPGPFGIFTRLVGIGRALAYSRQRYYPGPQTDAFPSWIDRTAPLSEQIAQAGAGAPPQQWIDRIAPTAPPLPGQPPPIILPGGQVLPPPSMPQRIIWGVAGRATVWGAIGAEIWRRSPDKAKREIKRRGKKVLRGAYDKAKEYGPWVAILAGFEAWRERRTRQGTMPADAGPSAADAPTAMPGGAPVRGRPRSPRTRGPRRGRRTILATPPLLPGIPGSPGDPGRAPRPTGTAPTALPGGAPAPSAPSPSSAPSSGPRVSWPSGPIGTPSSPPAPSRGAVLARQLLPFLPLLIPRGGGSRGRARAPGSPALLPALPAPGALPQTSYLTGFQGGAVGYRDCPPCEKKKRTGKRKTRTECFQGTYTEKASGLIKRKRKRVPCQ